MSFFQKKKKIPDHNLILKLLPGDTFSQPHCTISKQRSLSLYETAADWLDDWATRQCHYKKKKKKNDTR